MRWCGHRLFRLLLVTIFLLYLFPLWSSGARATSSVASQRNRFVVLLPGICGEDFSLSICAGPGTRIDPAARTRDFAGIVRQLGVDGIQIPKSNLYSYSYFIRNNLPHKTWYYAADTHEPLAVAAYQLDTQLRALVRAHPKAGFDLIGHSLGGVVAAYWVVKDATPGMLSRVHSLITLDSPVSGTKSPSAIIGGVFSGPVWLDLQPWSAPIRAIDDPTTGVVARLAVPVDQYTMSTPGEDGAGFSNSNRVYTISNTADQLIGPIDSQLSGARANLGIFSCPPAELALECHVAVLHDPQAITWAAAFAATTIRPIWSIRLAADRTSVPAGTTVTLTAVANRDVGTAGYAIEILDQTTGSVVKRCVVGSICVTTVAVYFSNSVTTCVGNCTGQPTPPPAAASVTNSYVARIGNQARSSPVRVEWVKG